MQGIYKIENTKNGKKYIGSSKNIEKRFYQHKRELELSSHHSIRLQRAWNKNKSVFSFEVIEEIDDIKLLKEREQYYIDFYDAYYNGYNCAAKVDNPRYTRKNITKREKAAAIPKLKDEFNSLYTPEKFYIKGISVRKLSEGLYSYSTYKFILYCMKWFLLYYPETDYMLQIDTEFRFRGGSHNRMLWVTYKNIDFAAYIYKQNKIIINDYGTKEIIGRLKKWNLYDERHHQLRGGAE